MTFYNLIFFLSNYIAFQENFWQIGMLVFKGPPYDIMCVYIYI